MDGAWRSVHPFSTRSPLGLLQNSARFLPKIHFPPSPCTPCNREKGGAIHADVDRFSDSRGAAAITTALITLLKTIWKTAPDPWATWALAEGTVFVGGILQGALTSKTVLLLAVSGMVVVVGRRRR